eukprot:scaffold51852_cov58-Phaeocystis_antarctica.AAC.2
MNGARALLRELLAGGCRNLPTRRHPGGKLRLRESVTIHESRSLRKNSCIHPESGLEPISFSDYS